MQRVLAAEGRRTMAIEGVRRRFAESDKGYSARLTESMAESGAHIAWLCIPPVPDLPLIMEAALLAGLSVVVEKPWLCSDVKSEELSELARRRRVLVGIHFQYCFLERVESVRLRARDAAKLKFSGTFTLSRSDRLGIPALDNLGSHLLAVREYAAPGSEVREIRCAYDLADERSVRIETEGGAVESIDLATGEPIIQRFVARFEEAIPPLEFPLDLRFARRVASALEAVRAGRPFT